MILGELYNLYLRLLDEDSGAIPHEGWSVEKVSWALPIGSDGSLGEPISLGGKDGTESKYRPILVPEHGSRSGIKPIPFYLCDTPAYLLGLEENKGEAKRRASCEMHLALLEGCEGREAEALRKFFTREDVTEGLSDANREALMQGGWCVLYFLGKGYATEVSELRDVWDKAFRAADPSDRMGQCGITGEIGPLARLFPQVTGIPGAQGSGASMVSFNKSAFESYGKKQSYNASISQSVAFGAGTALKYLFSDDRHKVRVGSTTVVFWSDKKADFEDALFLQMLGGSTPKVEDETILQLVKSSLESIRVGKKPASIDTSLRYYVLGISPNAARLAVRFFEVGTLGQIAQNFGQYLRDLEIDCDQKHAERRTTALLQLLKQTALLGDADNLPAPLVNPCFRALIRGTLFPSSLETALLSRMRADHANNKPWDMMERASLMKACLVRRRRLTMSQDSNNESEVTVALNRDNRNVGYLLGRLFAILERAQQGSLGNNVNATIRDKYMSSAATTPSRVYATLLGLGQKHISNIKKDASKMWLFYRIERELDEVFDLLGGEGCPIPATLSTDDQLLFYIGYYQERVDIWKKRESNQDDSSQSIEAAEEV